MRYLYYPGCSLEATAKEYNESAHAVCKHLDIELVELPDWNCCGATSAHSVSKLLSLALPARNLAIAEDLNMDIIAPCSACYNRLRRTNYLLKHNPEIREKVEKIVEFSYKGNINVYSLVEVIGVHYGVDKVKANVQKPLAGLKVVCYYGCMLVRPQEITDFDRTENPMLMDRIMQALGAEVKKWSFKTECCGAHQGIVNARFTRRLIDRLLEMAIEADADAIVTSCPLCQTTLEMRRDPKYTLPSFYFTELMEIALAVPQKSNWWKRHLVDPLPLLQSLSLAI